MVERTQHRTRRRILVALLATIPIAIAIAIGAWLLRFEAASLAKIEAAQTRAKPASPTKPVSFEGVELSDLSCIEKILTIEPPQQLVSPRRFPPHCPIEDPVAVRTPLREKRYMACRLALTFLNYYREDLRPLAREILGREILAVGDKGVRACRRISDSTTPSQHTFANAIDIANFSFDDGLEINVEEHWNSGDERERFVRAAARAACDRFSMVISPDYNEAHKDHIHADMGKRVGCKVDSSRLLASEKLGENE